jgi:hypothetical protein
MHDTPAVSTTNVAATAIGTTAPAIEAAWVAFFRREASRPAPTPSVIVEINFVLSLYQEWLLHDQLSPRQQAAILRAYKRAIRERQR